MRYLLFALALGMFPTLGFGFDVDQRRQFPAEAGSQVLKVISTADLDLFAGVIEAFQRQNPSVSVDYFEVSSTELVKALVDEGAQFDLAVSSAMDLQTKLANDGMALPFRSEFTAQLPDWAHWQDLVFAFTQEPAALVFSARDFDGQSVPRTRQELIAFMRSHPMQFKNRVGTYDIRSSGLGYLFATQDARTSETYWRLAEVMGNMNAQLYCCSGKMIEDVGSGKLAFAYNVLGSYAAAQTNNQDDIIIVEPSDFTTLMMRSALIPKNAKQPQLAGLFIDHLLSFSLEAGKAGDFPFPTLQRDVLEQETALRPIRLGPGLMVYLDRLKRKNFLKAWENAILQKQ